MHDPLTEHPPYPVQCSEHDYYSIGGAPCYKCRMKRAKEHGIRGPIVQDLEPRLPHEAGYWARGLTADGKTCWV